MFQRTSAIVRWDHLIEFERSKENNDLEMALLRVVRVG